MSIVHFDAKKPSWFLVHARTHSNLFRMNMQTVHMPPKHRYWVAQSGGFSALEAPAPVRCLAMKASNCFTLAGFLYWAQ